MTTTPDPGATHADAARAWIEFSGDLNPEGDPARAMHAIALGQAEATLALAAEQRAANLIARAALGIVTMVTPAQRPADVENLRDVLTAIDARLGA